MILAAGAECTLILPVLESLLLAVTVREEKHACSRWNALYNNIFVMFVIANVISKQALGDSGLETFTAHHLTLS